MDPLARGLGQMARGITIGLPRALQALAGARETDAAREKELAEAERIRQQIAVREALMDPQRASAPGAHLPDEAMALMLRESPDGRKLVFDGVVPAAEGVRADSLWGTDRPARTRRIEWGVGWFEVEFETAWTPPVAFVRACRKRWPELTITAEYEVREVIGY